MSDFFLRHRKSLSKKKKNKKKNNNSLFLHLIHNKVSEPKMKN